MKYSKLLIRTLFLTGLFLNLVEVTQAAQVTRSWVAKEADSTFNNAGSHAFWIPNLGYDYIFDSEAKFTEYDDGTATFTGSIVHEDTANRKWNFDLRFQNTNQGYGGAKKELPSGQYIENGGTINTNSWSFYDFLSADSTLSADSGKYAGKTLHLDDLTQGKYPVQVGFGANGKNTKMGLSTWFSYDGDLQGYGDINVDLYHVPEPTNKVPEPTIGILALALAGLATSSLKKNKKQY